MANWWRHLAKSIATARETVAKNFRSTARLGNIFSNRVQATTREEIALEDANIASQITLLKGLDHWQSPHVLRDIPSLSERDWGERRERASV